MGGRVEIQCGDGSAICRTCEPKEKRGDGRPDAPLSARCLLAASADGAGHSTEVDVPAAYQGLLRAGHGPMVGERNDGVNASLLNQ